MEWLEAMLAFAVVMMIFATFVSAIIEVLHRITRIREDGLKSMMIQVYEKVIQPEIEQGKQSASSSKDKFVESMTETRLLPVAEDAGLLRKLVHKTVNAEKLMSLPTQKFLERLVETDEGKQLIQNAAQQGKTQAQATLKLIAEQYEDFGDSARDFFTRRSRLLSTIIAIGLAITVNLDAFVLFKTFLADKGIRQAMIERGDAVSKELQTAQAKLEKTRSGQADTDDVDLDEITGKIDNFQQSIIGLEAAGIPIGWERAVWKTSAYKKADGGFQKALIILAWGFSVLLGGVLVGLGGPFWYNVFTKLGVLAGIQTGKQQPSQSDAPGQAPDTNPDDPLLDRIMETSPHAPKSKPRGRMLLQRDGNPDTGGRLL